MDLTPRLLHDVEFGQEWRGYDREEVDDFLERVAASVEQLLNRLKEVSERAPVQPAAADTEAMGTGGEEAITRTLVLAQRTADAAIAEAKETAAAMLTEAEERAAAIVAAAEADGRRVIDSARADAAAEAKQLEETRGLLQADVEALEQHLAEQRRAVESVVGQLQAMLADPEAMRAGERPELHVTPPIEPPAVEATGDDDGGPPTMEVATVVVDDDDDDEDDAVAEDDPVVEAATAAAPAAEEPSIDLSTSAASASDDDPFLAELRKAVTDDEPLGPRDHDQLMPAGRGIFDQDQLDSREGLRSRLRRRP